MTQLAKLPSNWTLQRWPDLERVFRDHASESDLLLVAPAELWVEPAGVALAASRLRARSLSGQATQIRVEDARAPGAQYLQRIDFFRSLGVDLPEAFRRRDPRSRFVEIRPLETEKVAERFSDEGVRCLYEQAPNLPFSLRNSLRFLLAELGVNIVHHSQRPESGFALAQSYSATIEIAFCDSGVGIPTNMRTQIPEASDADAILAALTERGTSGPPERNMGAGLHWLRQFVERVQGEALIASGRAVWHFQGGSDGGIERTDPIPEFVGTLVVLRCPTQLPAGVVG